MAKADWLVGQDRGTAAAERIYAAASDVVSRKGVDALTVDALAAKVHCSAATVYRHVGGKAAILEAVAVRLSARVVEAVRASIADATGIDRVVTAIVVALEHIRAEPLGHVIMGGVRPGEGGEWLTDSRLVAGIAEEIIGRDDEVAVQWLLRVTLALWFWPVQDRESEADLVRRFVAPSFAAVMSAG